MSVYDSLLSSVLSRNSCLVRVGRWISVYCRPIFDGSNNISIFWNSILLQNQFKISSSSKDVRQLAVDLDELEKTHIADNQYMTSHGFVFDDDCYMMRLDSLLLVVAPLSIEKLQIPYNRYMPRSVFLTQIFENDQHVLTESHVCSTCREALFQYMKSKYLYRHGDNSSRALVIMNMPSSILDEAVKQENQATL